MFYNDDIIGSDEDFKKIAKAFRKKLEGINLQKPPKQSRKPLSDQLAVAPIFYGGNHPKTHNESVLPEQINLQQPTNNEKTEQKQSKTKTELIKEFLQPNFHYAFADMIKIIENSNSLYNLMLFSEASLVELSEYLQANRNRVQTSTLNLNSFLQKIKSQKYQYSNLFLQNKTSSQQNIKAQKFTRQNSKLQLLNLLSCQNEILRLIFWMLVFTNISHNKNQLTLLNEMHTTHLSISNYLHSFL